MLKNHTLKNEGYLVLSEAEMTEEIIKSITEAEEKAAESKRLAEVQAMQILAEAEESVARMKETSAQVCKAYKETQTKAALEEAELAYNNAMEAKKSEAKSYCENALANSENAVNEIVRRIIGGDC